MSEPLPEGVEAPAVEPEMQAEEPEVEYAQIPVDQFQQMQDTLAALAPLAEQYQQMQQQPQQGYQQPQQVDLDPFAENFREQLDAYFDQRVAPIASYTEQQQMSEASEQAMDILNDHISKEGYTFLNEDSAERALELANQYVLEEQQKYGMGVQAAEAAIARAADQIRDYERSVGQKYAEQQMQEVQTLTGAPRQPGQAAPATQNLAIPAGDERAVLAKYYNR